jgi:riboflavin biosynthesis pyrimidine reductase
MSNVVQLYPLPAQEIPLQGLYLSHDLRTQAAQLPHPFVYTNYVVSLDGRIAVPRANGAGMTVPKDVANDRDWRLFQELAVQADVIISSGRYLRDYAEGNTQELLEVYDDPAFADLKTWREEQGLKPYPDFVVISASLEFPIPAALMEAGRRVIVATVEATDSDRRARLADQGADVFIAGEERVRGQPLVDALDERGYRVIYNATGPLVNHLLLADDVLDRLYLTYANRLLGGKPFDSIVTGELLDPAIGMQIDTIYLDPVALDGLGQLFLSYVRKEEK